MRARAQAGFTYIEAVIVLIVLGIMAALAVPTMHSTLSGAKLSGAADEIVAALEFAQLTALNSGRPCRVQVDAANRIVTVERFEGADLLGDAFGGESEIPQADVEAEAFALLPRPARPGESYRIVFGDESHLRDVQIASADFGGSDTVQFDTFGNPSAPGSVTLAYGSRQIVVSIEGLAGKVSRNN